MLYIGTAAWAIPKTSEALFPKAGSQLERYARVFPAVEINSSFYRPHRRATYERWAASVPDTFRFSVKVPKTITHVQRLRDADDVLATFLDACTGLGDKLGALLVQLPPSLVFEPDVEVFFVRLRERFGGRVAFEPRHASWFEDEAALAMLDCHGIARVAADPPRHARDGAPGGFRGFHYMRLHGTPRVYYSAYLPNALEGLADTLKNSEVDTWCIFDNTALGHATTDALTVLDDSCV